MDGDDGWEWVEHTRVFVPVGWSSGSESSGIGENEEDEEDEEEKKCWVTLCTHLSIDRIQRLSTMAHHWVGTDVGGHQHHHQHHTRSPSYLSVAIYLDSSSTSTSTVSTILDKIDDLRQSNKIIRERVFFHILQVTVNDNDMKDDVGNDDDVSPRRSRSSLPQYPINRLRNLSIKNAPTEWVVMLDIDFIPGPLGLGQLFLAFVGPSPNVSNNISDEVPHRPMEAPMCQGRIELSQLHSGKAVFVLPAFSNVKRKSCTSPSPISSQPSSNGITFAKSRSDILQGVAEGCLEQFRTTQPPNKWNYFFAHFDLICIASIIW
jgi:hypothetical protein